jgi:hypothetical protein
MGGRYIHGYMVAKAKRRQRVLEEYDEAERLQSAVRPDIGNVDHIDAQPEREDDNEPESAG